MEWDVASFPALISMRASCIAEDRSCRARIYRTSCSMWQRLLLRKHAWSTVNADECSDWPALSATDGCDWPSLSLAVNIADIADSDWIRRDSARSRTHWTRLRTNWSLHRVESLASAYIDTRNIAYQSTSTSRDPKTWQYIKKGPKKFKCLRITSHLPAPSVNDGGDRDRQWKNF